MNPLSSAVLALALAAAGAASPALAQTPAAQTASVRGEVILKIDGKLRGGRTFELTREELEKLPRSIVTTSTPWHQGTQVFEGVLLRDLLMHVASEGRLLRVTALNNYKTEIPVGDIAEHSPILAYSRNGKPMSVREKGPLFVIYPYDSDPALKSEIYFGRSAWQVATITIE